MERGERGVRAGGEKGKAEGEREGREMEERREGREWKGREWEGREWEGKEGGGGEREGGGRERGRERGRASTAHSTIAQGGHKAQFTPLTNTPQELPPDYHHLTTSPITTPTYPIHTIKG